MLERRSRLYPAFGMTALVLGHIALALFFMPILGIPLSLFGLAAALAGIVLALVGGWSSLRWSLAGAAVCALALSVNVLLHWAPRGYLPQPIVPPQWQPAPERPGPPPPRRP